MDSSNIKLIIQLVVMTALLASWLWRRHAAKQTSAWPTAEATIETGQFETVAQPVTPGPYSPRRTLPVFGFSFTVGGKFYGGWFALCPYITDPGEPIVTRMVGRKVQVKYDPDNPEEWFIPEKLIEGCKVEQKMGTDFFNFDPKN